jgi:hypothetical protein
MKQSSSYLHLRIAALIVVLLNIAFNSLYNYFPISGKTISEVTAEYHSQFTPAGYAFGIWGIIYLGFLIYSFVRCFLRSAIKPFTTSWLFLSS